MQDRSDRVHAARAPREVSVLVGLGSNLGDRRRTIELAVAGIGELEYTRWASLSCLRETEPAGGPPQGAYLNAAGEVVTRLDPLAFLDAVQEIERRLGRVRTVPNAPRTIDIDVLLWGDDRLDYERLQVPHPRMAERAFVLEPLAEIAPRRIDPASGRTLQELWEATGVPPAPIAGGPPWPWRRSMKVLEQARDVDRASEAFRRAGLSVGFVPTLGALHEGHLALLRQARRESDRVIASIYLNPTQFDSPEDLERYPASPEADEAMCRSAGVDVLFRGRREDLLPGGFETWVEVERLSLPLCGRSRPGHFRGVSTVVAQLLHIVRPHRAYFGMKDYQQLELVARMVRDLKMDVEVRRVPTVREQDGLALSSRNRRLAAPDREAAPAIFRALDAARRRLLEGETSAAALRAFLRDELARELRLDVEYAEVVDARSLEAFDGERVRLEGGALLAVAARLGGVRLIDSLEVACEGDHGR